MFLPLLALYIYIIVRLCLCPCPSQKPNSLNSRSKQSWRWWYQPEQPWISTSIAPDLRHVWRLLLRQGGSGSSTWVHQQAQLGCLTFTGSLKSSPTAIGKIMSRQLMKEPHQNLPNRLRMSLALRTSHLMLVRRWTELLSQLKSFSMAALSDPLSLLLQLTPPELHPFSVKFFRPDGKRVKTIHLGRRPRPKWTTPQREVISTKEEETELLQPCHPLFRAIEQQGPCLLWGFQSINGKKKKNNSNSSNNKTTDS